MKTSYIFGIILLFTGLVLVLIVAVFNQPAAAQNLNGAPLHQQITPTPLQDEDASVIGSTDGILVMGFVIMLIIIIPVIIHKINIDSRENKNLRKLS